MKLTLIALGLAASTAAFASTPTYKCGTSPDSDNVKSPVLLTLNDDGSIAQTMKLLLVTRLSPVPWAALSMSVA
jgi:hypothetical protein